MDENLKKLENDIPSSYLDKFDKISKDAWKHEDFRKKVLELCDETHNTHNFVVKIEGIFEDSLKKEVFIDKVKSLSSKEIKDYIDKSRVKTVFWILGLIVVAVVSILVQKTFNIF
jgi:hypothetical protein